MGTNRVLVPAFQLLLILFPAPTEDGPKAVGLTLVEIAVKQQHNIPVVLPPSSRLEKRSDCSLVQKPPKVNGSVESALVLKKPLSADGGDRVAYGVVIEVRQNEVESKGDLEG